MSKHTEGPLFVAIDDPGDEGFGPVVVAISTYEDDAADAICWVNVDLPQWEANAKLLAAAPDLLAALKQATEFIIGFEDYYPVSGRVPSLDDQDGITVLIAAARAAIAKAEGGA